MKISSLKGKDAIFIFLFLSAVVLQFMITAGVDVRQYNSETTLSPQESQVTSNFQPEDPGLKTKTTVGIIFIIVFSIGLSINFLALAFFIGDRKGIKKLFLPDDSLQRYSYFKLKEILYFLSFSFFTVQIFRAIFYLLREFLTISQQKMFVINLIAGTLGIQLLAFLFIFLYSKRTYNRFPSYFHKTRDNFLAKSVLTSCIFLGMLPWILLLALLGVYLSQKLGIPIQSHIITDYISRNALSFSSVYLIAYAAIGAPFFEEFIFRGFIYTTLKKKWGFLASVFMTSLIFAVFHMNFIQFFYIFGLGVALTLVFESTSNLIYPMMLHCLNNILSIVITLFLKSN